MFVYQGWKALLYACRFDELAKIVKLIFFGKADYSNRCITFSFNCYRLCTFFVVSCDMIGFVGPTNG